MYLEVGPGHGAFFYEVVRHHKFEHFMAADFSETSLEMTKDFLGLHNVDTDCNCEFINGDCTKMDFTPYGKVDMICISEVLEHLENPKGMLERLFQILSDQGSIYINVPINAPSIDHIYLFRSVEEVQRLVEDVGFEIYDSMVATANNVSYEKAVKFHYAISYAMLVKKKSKM